MRPQAVVHASQQTLPGRVLTVAWSVRFDIYGKREKAADYRRQNGVIAVADDLMLGMAVRATPTA